MTDAQDRKLAAIAARMKMDPVAALDFVLAEFDESTPADREQAKTRRAKAREAYLWGVRNDPFARELALRSWNAGFSAGWTQYQVRHTVQADAFPETRYDHLPERGDTRW